MKIFQVFKKNVLDTNLYKIYNLHTPMPYFLALTLCLCLSSCCSIKPTTPYFPISYEDYNFFNDGRAPELKEFNNITDKALKGDNDALAQTLSWAAITEGEGSKDYAHFLLKLQEKVGEERFVHAFNRLSPEEQGIVKSIITTHPNLEKFTSNLDKI